MSEFWSSWVMLLMTVNLGVILFLFIWGLFVDIPTQPDGTSGHVWAHGVLREAVRKLPAWWIVISAAAFVVALGYLALFPGFGAFGGFLGWTSRDELERAEAANRQLEAPLRERMRGQPIAAIATHAEALRVGAVIFVENCAACHGRDARGNLAIGAPDLTDNDSLYGNDGQAILTSILDGRRGTMPAFGDTLPAESILDLAHYVASLSNSPYDSLRAQIGRPLFSNCVACHGAEGKGNPALGAPNLTDNTRLHGATVPRAIAEIIRRGKSSVMPAWRGRLSDDDAALVAAWVYARSHTTAAPAR
jgi:cytochrome c oxidase cbb3-type subunit 3